MKLFIKIHRPLQIFSCFTIIFLISSCKTTSKIRTLDETHAAYKELSFSEIERLSEAAQGNNRDVSALSVHYLGNYLTHLTQNPKKHFKKISPEAINQAVVEVQGTLEKIYAINTDFNIKCNAIVSHSKYVSQQNLNFLTSVIEENELLTTETALHYLPVYLTNQKYDVGATIKVLHKKLNSEEYPVTPLVLKALEKLATRGDSSFTQSSEILKNFRTKTKDYYLKALTTEILSQ